MTEYNYTKTGVNSAGLMLQIKQSTSITTTCSGLIYNAPSSLKILFEEDLDSGEKSTLDTIVENHAGEEPDHYRLYCAVCEDERALDSIGEPTECPACQSEDISDVIQQGPFVSVKDELGNDWEIYVNSSGNLISARRYDL